MTRRGFLLFLLDSYLILSIVNWLPAISIQTLSFLKLGLFVSIFVVLVSQVRIKFPSRLLSVDGLLLLVGFSGIAIIQASNNNTIFLHLKDLVGPFISIWVMYNLPAGRNVIVDNLNKVTVVVVGICYLSVLSNIMPQFDLVAPHPFNSMFSKSGLGGYRTGWSNSLFLFVPFIFYNNIIRSGRYFTWKGFFMVAPILLCQYLSGGRAGLLASIATIAFIGLQDIRITVLIVLSLIGALEILPAASIEEQFRTSDQYIGRGKSVAHMSEFEYFDRLSSYRLTGYVAGWKLFENKPFIGYGLGESDFLSDRLNYNPDIHNVWLKRLVEGGMLMTLPLVAFFFHVSKKVFEITKKENGSIIPERTLFLSLFIPAIVISLLEPNYLIGSFQGEAFFWFIIGFLLRSDGLYGI